MKPQRRWWTAWGVAGLLLVAAVAVYVAMRPMPEITFNYWLWAAQKPAQLERLRTALAAACERRGLTCREGPLRIHWRSWFRDGSQSPHRLSAAGLRPRQFWLTYRLEALAPAHLVARHYRRDAAALTRQGVRVLGLEIDHDSPSAKLAAYAAWLGRLRDTLGDTPVTTTALPAWFTDNLEGARRLAATADRLAVMFYRNTEPLPITRRSFAAINSTQSVDYSFLCNDQRWWDVARDLAPDREVRFSIFLLRQCALDD